MPFKFCYGNEADRSWAVSEAVKLCGEGVHGTAPGQITDDGELTLSLLRGLQAGQQFAQTKLTNSRKIKMEFK